MKNLFGAIAPTNRVLESFKFLMLVVLVAIGFTSCKDQSKFGVSTETEIIAKSDLQDAQSNFDGQGTTRKFCDIGGGIGGQERRNLAIGGSGIGQTPLRRICDLCLGKEPERTSFIGGQSTTRSYSDIGGNQAPPRRICDAHSKIEIGGKGGKGTSSGGEYYSSDIGGRSTTGESSISDIGGRGTNTGTGEYSISDIGGKSTTGEYAISNIEDKSDVLVIGRKLEPFSADIGGRSSVPSGL